VGADRPLIYSVIFVGDEPANTNTADKGVDTACIILVDEKEADADERQRCSFQQTHTFFFQLLNV